MARSFWAIELHPGKEYATTPDFDLHITQAVLTGASKDKSERSVISVKIADEEGGEAKTFSIASLKLDHADSQGLDLVFDQEEEIVFTVSGKNTVHLSGYLIPPNGDEDDFGDEFGSDDEEIPSGEEFGSEDEDEEEADDDIQAQIAAKRKAIQQQNGAPAKKAKQEAPQQPQAQKPKQQQQTPNKPAEQKKPQQQQQQKSPAQQQQKVAAPRKLQGGVEATIMKEGTGKTATRGNKVFVKYVGTLTKNGKVFDKSVNKTFGFALGKREVITGWDIGVDGMKEGEKRKLIIPSALAYGAGGAPPTIPPNASLTFEVELVKVAGK